MLGLNKLPEGYKKREINEHKQLKNILQAPDKWDWRDQGAVTPVKNQGACGSCWAFSVIAGIEGSFFQEVGTLTEFSEQNIMDCVRNGINNGCNGGHYVPAWDYMKKMKQGFALMKDYPYTGKDETCRNFTEVGFVNDWSLYNVDAARLRTILSMFVVAVAIEAENDLFRAYSGGVITKDCGTNLDHAVTAVGYGTDDNGQEYFIVKNSWGTSWGEQGYVRIAPDQCGITLYPAIVEIEQQI